jgi:hypothetical protein
VDCEKKETMFPPGRYGGELEQASGVFLEGDSARGSLFDGAGDLVDGLGEVPILHANDGLAGLLHPAEDLLVLDLEFGISLGLFADYLGKVWYSRE